MLFSGSLRKLFLFVILLSLAPSLGIIVYSNIRTGRHELRQAERQAQDLVHDQADRQASLLDGVSRTLEAMSPAPSIRELDPKEAPVFLSDVLRGAPDLAYLAVVGPDGAVLLAGGSMLGADLASLAAEALATDTVVAGGMHPAAKALAVLPLALAVHGGREGGTGAVLVAGVRAEALARTMGASVLPAGASLVLADRRGALAAGLGPEFGAAQPGQPLRRSLWERMVRADGAEVFAEPDPKQPPTVYAVRQVCPGPRAKACLRLALAVPEDSILAEARNGLRQDMLLAAAAGAASLAAAGVAGSLTLGRTLRRIKHAVDRIRQGDLAARTGLDHAPGSLGQLAAGIDRMAGTLQEDLAARRRLEAQLIAARDAAEASSRAKDEFLANMSHEIRTPLNGMLGMLSLLRTARLPKELDSYAAVAGECGNHLLALLSDILDLSRLEAGRMPLREAPFSPARLLEGIAALFAPTCAEKDLVFAAAGSEDLPPALLGDEARLRQVLFNLTGNAVKFTERGGVRLEAWRLPGAGEGAANLLFAVADTGPGIADSKLHLMFERFTQSDGSFTRQHQGAGLGLAIVRRIARLMGASLAVDSEEGRGTTVYFGVRLRTAAALAPEAGVPGASPQLRALRVLVAEDDPVNRTAARVFLERLGHAPHCVDNGRQALDALGRHRFDCVLMDIQMPEMDGLAATRAIRTDPTLAEAARIPVVALTAHAMDGDRERFLAAGLDDYLAKPFTLEDLAAVLERQARRTAD